MILCRKCRKTELKHDQFFSADYCETCNIWDSPPCGDAGCLACFTRPTYPNSIPHASLSDLFAPDSNSTPDEEDSENPDDAN